MSINLQVTHRGQRAGPSYKWAVMLVVIFGLFMVMLDTTIVNSAMCRLALRAFSWPPLSCVRASRKESARLLYTMWQLLNE